MAYMTGVTRVTDRTDGGKLRAYLKSNHVSVNELSRRSGIDLRTVRRITKGEHEGNIATWRAFARVLRCGLDDIVDV